MLHKGAGRQTSSLLVLPGLGQAIPHSLICSSNTCLSAYYVPVTVLGTGESQFTRSQLCSQFWSSPPGVRASES